MTSNDHSDQHAARSQAMRLTLVPLFTDKFLGIGLKFAAASLMANALLAGAVYADDLSKNRIPPYERSQERMQGDARQTTGGFSGDTARNGAVNWSGVYIGVNGGGAVSSDGSGGAYGQ